MIILPSYLNRMIEKDPFIMNENTVNIAVWNFLKSAGCICPRPLRDKEHGVDVQGEKNGWKIYVESKGSTANKNNDNNIVFDTGQIKDHTYHQIGKLMEYQQTKGIDNHLFIMANPDIPRIRYRVNSVINSLNKLGFVQFWVQEDNSIKIENPDYLNETLIKLGLKNN